MVWKLWKNYRREQKEEFIKRHPRHQSDDRAGTLINSKPVQEHRIQRYEQKMKLTEPCENFNLAEATPTHLARLFELGKDSSAADDLEFATRQDSIPIARTSRKSKARLSRKSSDIMALMRGRHNIETLLWSAHDYYRWYFCCSLTAQSPEDPENPGTAIRIQG